MTTQRPMPGDAAPALEVETTAGAWSLADRSPENFVMVVFYRCRTACKVDPVRGVIGVEI